MHLTKVYTIFFFFLNDIPTYEHWALVSKDAPKKKKKKNYFAFSNTILPIYLKTYPASQILFLHTIQ